MTLGWYLTVALGGAGVIFVCLAILGAGVWVTTGSAIAWALLWKLLGPLVVDRDDRRYWDGR